MKMLVDVCDSLHSCEVLCLEVCSVCSKPSSHAFSSINQPPDPLSHLPSLCQWAVNCLAHCPTAILALWPTLPCSTFHQWAVNCPTHCPSTILLPTPCPTLPSSIPLPMGCQLPYPLSYHRISLLTHFTIFHPTASGLFDFPSTTSSPIPWLTVPYSIYHQIPIYQPVPTLHFASCRADFPSTIHPPTRYATPSIMPLPSHSHLP